MTMPNLLPCPFCGHIPTTGKTIYGDYYLAHKPGDERVPRRCIVPNFVYNYPTVDDAARAWNKRTEVKP